MQYTRAQGNGAMIVCKALKLDGLVIIGGVTSNTYVAQLAEAKCSTKIQTDLEELLIIKPRESLLNVVTEHVKENHESE
ncbi:hypothetical protein L6452_30929 [Arctium lappa]|uniref:Uncharacterized protein n=1 Tax=Arctium lappa TaxID=4217 RepID=A0ACB8ZJ36_ARCLA|nr:hypothetical protein L6452_30929 [Arctium lappa]